MGSAHGPNDTADTAVVTAGDTTTRGARVERDLDRWKAFLRDEDRRCEELHLGAALVTVGLVHGREANAAIRALLGALRPTDRVGVLGEDELTVLVAPVDDIRHAQKLVQAIDAALRSAGVAAHIGWAPRAEGHGLFHAAARADAAMLTARGHGRLDLSRPLP